MKNGMMDAMAELIVQMSHAADNEGSESDRSSWMSFFDMLRVFSPEQIEEGMGIAFGKYGNIQVIALFVERLTKLGLDESDDPVIEAVYRSAWKAFFRHAPPELRQTIREGIQRFFPELRPVGCDSRGELLFLASDLAKIFGEDEVKSHLEKEKFF